MAASEKRSIAKKVHAAVQSAIKSGEWSRYRLSQKSGVAYRVLTRFLDEESDIKLSTAAALLETLGYTICHASKCKDR